MFNKIAFIVMNPAKTVSAAVLGLMLVGGAVQTAWADLPNTPANVKIMDKNKDGKIQKAEYLAYMGAQFDRLAGGKGYCTFEEVSSGIRNMGSVFPPGSQND